MSNMSSGAFAESPRIPHPAGMPSLLREHSRMQSFATFRCSASRRNGLASRTNSGTPRSTGHRSPACETSWCTTTSKWTLRRSGSSLREISLPSRRQCAPSWLCWTSRVRAPRSMAPRKPERFPVVVEKLGAAGIVYVRRQALGPGDAARVLLLDTIGELSSLFSLADVVFMGGTLARRGGHNILEPALFAKPVIMGPHMENFQAIAEEFRAAGACVEIAGGQELAGALERLLQDLDGAREIGRRAQACAEVRRGATARAIQEVRRLHGQCVPRARPPLP